MPDVTGTNIVYPSYLLDTFKGGVHTPETDSLKLGLLRSSYVYDPGHTDLSNVSGDEAFGNGYSRQTLSNVVIANDGDWITLTADQVQFSAAGGNFSAKYWFLFNDTAAGFPLITYGQIDDGRSDEVVLVDGKTLDIVINELGLYRVPV